MAELNAAPRKPWVGLAIGIVIGLLLFGSCFVLGSAYFLAARPPPRSTQSEVKSNLKYAFTVQKASFGEHDRYDESIEAVGFMPERGNRYRYVFSRTGDAAAPGSPADGGVHTQVLADEGRTPPPDNLLLLTGVPTAGVGLEGTCPSCEITIYAVGNLDSDSTVDVWSISTKQRTIAGESVSPGQPYNHVNDLER
ncbi:MAG: hypothetical protein Q8L48_09495 [Archangium sp.]|nr:hypothetical protein [Archangium sp.]